jgi:hypothetical protein
MLRSFAASGQAHKAQLEGRLCSHRSQTSLRRSNSISISSFLMTRFFQPGIAALTK